MRGPDSDVLVGRADEMARLRALVRSTASGQGGAVLVEGEPGIGKSAVLTAGLADAERLGCQVLRAAGDELGERFPLRALLAGLSPGQRAEITGEDPSREAWPGGTADPVHATIERLLALIDRLCAVSPVVLIMDDMQWADESSLLVWHRLSRNLDQLPLLLVGAYRPTPARPETDRLRHAVTAAGGALLSLTTLPSAEVAELVDALTGGSPPLGLRERVLETGGNPLYVRELVDAALRENPVGDGPVRMPVSLAAAIDDRLAALRPETGRLLRTAALVGIEFTVLELAAVIRKRPLDLADQIDEAAAAGVLIEAGPKLAFRHPLIRHALHEAIPAGLRAPLHRQIAEGLAGASATVERVAEHLMAATGVMDMWQLDWIGTAGDELARKAPVLAAELLERAVDHDVVDEARRVGLEARLVPVLQVLARHEKVERLTRQALLRGGDRGHAARMTWALALTLLRTGRSAEGLDVLDELLADPPADGSLVARVRAVRALLTLHLGRPDEAKSLAERALAEGESAGDVHAIGFALHVLSVAALIYGDSAATVAFVDRALALPADDVESIDARLLLMTNRISALLDLDRWHDAEAGLRDAMALAERVGGPRAVILQSVSAHELFLTGRWDDAAAEVESALARSDELPDQLYLPVRLHGMRAFIAGCQDDGAMFAQHLDAVRDIVISPGAVSNNASFLLIARALAEERGGRPDRALAVLEPVLVPEHLDLGRPDVVLPALVRVAIELGEDEVARKAARAWEQALARECTEAARVVAGRCRGMIDRDPGPLLAAADRYRAVNRPFDLAETLEDAAVLLSLRGDLASAKAAVAEAVTAYEQLGAAWNLRRLDARVRPHGIRRGQRGPRRRPAGGWEALTPTELKVARLIARRYSNPDIAADLCLSRRTVQTHVSHILTKLNMSSRVAIAEEALRREGGDAPVRTA